MARLRKKSCSKLLTAVCCSDPSLKDVILASSAPPSKLDTIIPGPEEKFTVFPKNPGAF